MMAYWRTHDVLGSHFCGVVMQQYWADLPLWEQLFNTYPEIHTVVELGAFQGGMTLFLAMQTRARGLEFYSFDRFWPVALHTPLARELRLQTRFYLGDFWKETNGALLDLLHDPAFKPLMLLVDGGNKPQEFKAFVPELSSGDYCAVHDYSTEFQPADADPVAHLLEPVLLDECLAPPQPCLTRFWRVK